MTNKRAISTLNSLKDYYNDKKEDSYVGFDSEDNEALDLAIKALEQQTCEDVLEKIKTEILDEAEYAYADFDRYKEDILHAEPDELPDDDFRYGLERAVEIINKYKAESEE